jgi:hypothetical protein
VDIKRLFAATLLSACAITATPAQASPIFLTTPLTGSNAAGPFVDLTVSFDPNDHAATNLTGWELYVAFTGLSPIDSSFSLGSIVSPFATDVIELHGICGEGAPCSNPADPLSSGQWVSLASVFAPHLPQGPGTLFSLRFAVDPLETAWTLNVFGESPDGAGCGASGGLLWEHPVDGPCAISPFLIVPEGAAVDGGIARVGVSAVAVPEVASVPEPSTVLLLAVGLGLGLARRRVR